MCRRETGGGGVHMSPINYTLKLTSYAVRWTHRMLYSVHTVHCTPMSVTKCIINKQDTYMLSSTRHFIFFTIQWTIYLIHCTKLPFIFYTIHIISFAWLLWGGEGIYVMHTSRPDCTVARLACRMECQLCGSAACVLGIVWGGDVDRGILNGDWEQSRARCSSEKHLLAASKPLSSPSHLPSDRPECGRWVVLCVKTIGLISHRGKQKYKYKTIYK